MTSLRWKRSVRLGRELSVQDCRDGHTLSVVGRITLRFCPECACYEVRVWASCSETPEIRSLIPEWAEMVRLPADEWTERSLNKYIRGLAESVRTLEVDERNGVARLPF